jgi:DNA protecting protein DprA
LLGYSAGQPQEHYRLPQEAAVRFLADREPTERMAQELEEKGISVLVWGSPEYPPALVPSLGDKAPPVLFTLGNRHILRKPAVGFAGSRDCSATGLAITGECAASLAHQGVNTISGHANGVDLEAHRASLEAGGMTALVLAEGILRFRLKSVLKHLANEENCLVISEFPPKLPWSVANAMTRNRTICGLSNALLVIESGLSGGTFAAGKTALEIGCPLFVVDYGEPPPSAAGNAYLLSIGGNSLRRNSPEQVNLQPLIRAITTRFENGNHPVGQPPSLFSSEPVPYPSPGAGEAPA